MVNDPHQILGVSQNATQDEIKKAYRRKAKEYHPDLHPNDPNASRKMNEINEAYDMLMNPQKYEAQKCRQAQSQRESGYNSGGYGGNYSSGAQGGSYGSQNSRGSWYESSDDFGFEDIFGFGFEQQEKASMIPEYESGDSPQFRRVVDEIKSRHYQEAVNILTFIPGSGRNARWYYLSSLANHGLGNTIQAIDQMQKAAQMNPNNRTYQILLKRLRKSEQTYENNAQGFNMNVMNMQKVCFGCLAIQCLCGPYGCFKCV